MSDDLGQMRFNLLTYVTTVAEWAMSGEFLQLCRVRSCDAGNSAVCRVGRDLADDL